PSNAPVVTDLQQAEENVELAVLSAIEHGQNPNTALAARIASAAIVASAAIDAARSRLYLDLILISLSESAREALKDAMNSLGFEYQSDFARRYFGEGKTEGRIDLTLKLLARRFGPLPDSIQTRVRGANDAQLDTIAERLFSAQTLEQALESL